MLGFAHAVGRGEALEVVRGRLGAELDVEVEALLVRGDPLALLLAEHRSEVLEGGANAKQS